MTEPTYTLVAAVAKNGVIGAEGGLPWSYPRDLQRFKEITEGGVMIVGRKTYESFGDSVESPLPNRTHIVVSTSELELPSGVIQAGSVPEAREMATGRAVDEVFVVGGASMYEAFLPLAERVLVTRIKDEYPGDTKFPEWHPEEWNERLVKDFEEFAFYEYTRK